jgi:hypothetical protein
VERLSDPHWLNHTDALASTRRSAREHWRDGRRRLRCHRKASEHDDRKQASPHSAITPPATRSSRQRPLRVRSRPAPRHLGRSAWPGRAFVKAPEALEQPARTQSANCGAANLCPSFFSCMSEPLIERQEVVALLFNVSDIAITLTSIERFLKEDEDDGEEEADQS